MTLGNCCRLYGKLLRKSARIAISRKRHFLSPKRKTETTFQYQVPPKTWENSETTFGHSKVGFRPLLRTKCVFSQNPLTSRFVHYLGVNSFITSGPKALSPPAVFFGRLGSPSRPMGGGGAWMPPLRDKKKLLWPNYISDKIQRLWLFKCSQKK